MKKCLLLVLCTSVVMTMAAQQGQLPTLRASSTTAYLTIIDDHAGRMTWLLEPPKNPDIYLIGSRWPGRPKKITFTTDTDSVSFTLEAGSHYDLTVLLSGNKVCHIRIAAMADPVLLNRTSLLLISAALLVFGVIAFRAVNRSNNRRWIKAGYVAVAGFWVLAIISGAIHGNYHHARDVVSELGAIGTASELFTSLSLLVIAAFCILFSAGWFSLSGELKINRLPAILSLAMPVVLSWAALFPLGNELHAALGPVPLIVLLAHLLAVLLWRKQGLTNLKKWLVASVVIMLLLLTRFIPSFEAQWPGLVQRFFYAGWSVGVIAIVHYLTQLKKAPDQ